MKVLSLLGSGAALSTVSNLYARGGPLCCARYRFAMALSGSGGDCVAYRHQLLEVPLDHSVPLVRHGVHTSHGLVRASLLLVHEDSV